MSDPPSATAPINHWPFRIGGLMRCCTQTLRLSVEWATEGQVVKCFYCDGSMRLRDGAWEWNRPSTVPDHLPDNDESRGHGSVR